MVVDSCHDASGRPAALAYLESIGVPPEQIVLLIATHWHDDHVRGFSELVQQTPNATLCMSKIFTKTEFVAFLSAYNKSHPADRLPSGASELLSALNIAKETNRRVTIAQPDRCLLRLPGPPAVEVWSLSPSDACLQRFMSYVATNMPQKGETKTRAPAIKANETAVALLVKSGEHAVLLGADLEETHQGWSAILASQGRPLDKSTLFKIPHHGSITGHHDGVWENMLIPNPVSILTPYNRSSKLPTANDTSRILGLTDKLFITQPHTTAKKISRPTNVEKTIKDCKVKITQINMTTGHIRAFIESNSAEWNIELFNGAAAIT